MTKEGDKITIFRNLDREYYNLINRIELTKFGSLKFDNKLVEEIKVKNGKPYQVITIEKSTLLAEDYE